MIDLFSYQNQQFCLNLFCQYRGFCFFIKCFINDKFYIISYYLSCDVYFYFVVSVCLVLIDLVLMDNLLSFMEKGFIVYKQRNSYYKDLIDFLDMRGKKSVERVN